MATPKLYIELKNNTQYKPFNEVQTFDYDRDGGKRTKIKDTDGAYAIPITHIDNLKKIILKSDNCTLRITTTIDIDIPVNGLLIYDVEESFASTITGIAVLTTATEDTEFDLRIFGQSAVS